MDAMHHLDAAVDALVAHLQGALNTALGSGVAAVVRGFVDTQTLTDAGVVEKLRVGIVAGQSTDTGHAPLHVGSGTYSAVTRQRYAVGNWRASMQVDIVTDSRTKRDEAVVVVGAALRPHLLDAGLTLTCTTHHDAKARFRMQTSDNVGDSEAVTIGAWRHTITLRSSGQIRQIRAVPVVVEANAVDLTTGDTLVTVE